MGKTRKMGSGRIGAKICSLRKESGMSRAELAKKAGLSSETLTRLEKDEEIPPVATILRISRALSLDAGGLLNQAEKEVQSRKKKEGLEKRKRSYAYKTLSAGSADMRLKAFLIRIDPLKDHEMVEYRHEGEEFIYVLQGELDVTVGEDRHHLTRGKSLHFDASNPHMLRNPGSAKTELIVVLYTP